jgi:hypothetical protein
MAVGGGRMGGRGVPCCWRWVSISLTSMAGAAVLAGLYCNGFPGAFGVSSTWTPS